MAKNIFYINGKFVPELNAKISVYDLGLLRSYGVFDLFRTYNRKPFFLDAHLERLQNSAKSIGLKMPCSKKTLKKLVARLLIKNKHLKEATMRIVLTGGQSPDGITSKKPSLIIMATPLLQMPKQFYKTGAKLILWPAKRVLPEAKSLVYLEAIKALQSASQNGACEILYCSKEGCVLECATSNFFAVRNNEILTPPLQGILAGVTRKIAISLAKKLKIPVKEKPIKSSQLRQLDEVFLTATNKDILPIVQIGDIKIGHGQIGPITKRLMTAFEELTRNY
jgi:branched-chain amino acid aminotransferase